MKALNFLIWLREFCIPCSKEGDCLGAPSNGELRRWLKKGAARVNGTILTTDSMVEWPITDLVFFPKNPTARVTIR